MNAFLIFLLAALLLPAHAADAPASVEQRVEDILQKAYSKRYDSYRKVDRDYRTAVATTFQFADRVEVFLLDLSIGKDPGYEPKDGDATFPIRPYEDATTKITPSTKILKTAKVPAKKIPTWCAAASKMITTKKEGSSALCHYPIHGLRIFSGEKLLFETSICWKCGNYYFNYVNGSSWEDLSEDAKDLKTLLDDFMPIPEAEKARLHGG